MMPSEQGEFFVLVTAALGEYVKTPSGAELEAWWASCRHLSLEDVERALKAHAASEEDGKRAPRPIDVKRRIGYGVGSQQGGCAVGGCQFPGVFSDSTTGGEQWYCPWHREARVGPEAARWVEVSERVAVEEAFRKRVERIHEEGRRSPSVVATAHAIALRHGDRPWQDGPRFVLPAALAARLKERENTDAEPCERNANAFSGSGG
jgi:hypothetical protein